jgi:integrase
VNELPCHHNLDQFLDEWLTAFGLAKEPTSPLFPTMRHGALVDRTPLTLSAVYRMIYRRALSAGIAAKVSYHSFRATGITTYLQNPASWKLRSRWLDMNQRQPLGSSTVETTLLRWMRSNGLLIRATSKSEAQGRRSISKLVIIASGLIA